MRGFAPLLLVAYLTGCGHPPGDSRRLERDEVLMRVSATGEAETRPDIARFSAGVSSIAQTSEAATSANNTKMTAVLAAVEALGVKKDDTQTQALSVGRIDYGPNRGRFEASNTVSVKVRKMDDASRVIGAATTAGANILSGPDLSVDDKEAANLSAYGAAYKAARARAEAYATAAGLKIVRILTINDGSQVGEPAQNYALMANEAPRAVAPPPIRPGMNTSSATVQVDFVLGK